MINTYTPATGDCCILYSAPRTQDADGDILLHLPDDSGYYRYTRMMTLSRFLRQYVYSLA